MGLTGPQKRSVQYLLHAWANWRMSDIYLGYSRVKMNLIPRPASGYRCDLAVVQAMVQAMDVVKVSHTKSFKLLRLHYADDNTLLEVADLMRLTRAQVYLAHKKALEYVYAALKAEFDRRGLTYDL